MGWDLKVGSKVTLSAGEGGALSPIGCVPRKAASRLQDAEGIARPPHRPETCPRLRFHSKVPLACHLMGSR